jgi:hypothetical protein
MGVTLLHALAAVVLAASPANPDSVPSLLSVPASAVLLCRIVAPASSDRSVTIEMQIGRPADPVNRTVNVTFDSVGHPRALTDKVMNLDRNHGIVMRSAGVHFREAGTAGFTAMHHREWSRPEDRFAAVAKDSLRGDYALLTAAQQDQARVLARWVWSHRCLQGAKPADAG